MLLVTQLEELVSKFIRFRLQGIILSGTKGISKGIVPTFESLITACYVSGTLLMVLTLSLIGRKKGKEKRRELIREREFQLL